MYGFFNAIDIRLNGGLDICIFIWIGYTGNFYDNHPCEYGVHYVIYLS
jgi:hypothetical protein